MKTKLIEALKEEMEYTVGPIGSCRSCISFVQKQFDKVTGLGEDHCDYNRIGELPVLEYGRCRFYEKQN